MLDTVQAIAIAAILMPLVVLLVAAILAATARRKAAGSATPPEAPTPRGRKISRRSWFSWLGLGWTAFAASILSGASASGRFMFPNVLFEPPSTFKAGRPSDVKPGQVDLRFQEKFGVWLVRDVDPITGAKGIAALSDICTHLGCIPNWLETEQKFKCPCHGSGYYKNGINFEGPTPRPLERFAISIGDDGQIVVDKTHKFQYEKGQWADPRSFLKLA